MTLATDFTKLYVEGFAQLLDDASIGLTFQASGEYDASETGIFIAAVPARPDRCVTLTPYQLAAKAVLSESTMGLQIRARSAGPDVRDAWSIIDSIDNVLLGLFPYTLPGGVRVESLAWSSGGSLGQDEQHRWSWASNYRSLTHRPSLHRN